MLSLLRRRLRSGTATRTWALGRVPMQGTPPVHDPSRCELSGACAAACPVGAIDVTAAFSLDRGRCIACARCIEACPTGALARGLVFSVAAPTRAALVEPRRVDELGTALRERTRRILGRSLHVRHLDAGSCNGCDWEINAATNAVHDVQRFGVDFVASPRHADVLLVTGTVTRALEIAARRTYDAIADPRLVVAVGACAVSGSPYPVGYASSAGAAEILPVDVFVPGCPPRPEAIIEGLLAVMGKMPA